MTESNRKIIAIIGPTASGKTGIGVKLAREFNGEIISADSRQVYRGLDLGTGKEGVLKKDGLLYIDDIAQHLVDIKEPGEEFSLFDYLPKAREVIEDIFKRGKLPIIVGGTGLYVQGIVEGFELEEIAKKDSKIYSRQELDDLTLSELQKILSDLDEEKFKKVDKKNRHRLIRAIELSQSGLKPIKVKPDFEVLQIALDLPRKELFSRIDQRVGDRFNQGMLEEVIGLLKRGVSENWLLRLGLEYRIITGFLLKMRDDLNIDISSMPLKKNVDSYERWQVEYDRMKKDLKYKIHQYARRQLTWFRRFPEVNWLSSYDDIKRFTKIFLEH